MFETIIGAFLYAIVLASIYSLATMGLNLIFGVMKIVNFAHADFLTFGGYIAYWSWALLSFNPITSIPISALIGFIAGLSIFNVLIRKLIQTSSESTIIVTFSLGLVFQESMKTLWTADYRGTPWTLGNISFLSVSIPVTYIIVTLTGIIGIFCMYTILYKTYFGKSLRAIICNSDAAAICGVRVMHTLALGFALGITTAFIAGNLLIIYAPISLHPYMGREYMLKCLMISILGGLGNPWGALIGSLIFALFEHFLPLVLSCIPGIEPFSTTLFFAFVAFLVVLLVRPRGVLGGQ